MKSGFFTIFSIWCCALSAQVNFEGLVKDAHSLDPLPFCPVAVKNTTTGSISNEQGYFKIQADPLRDTLLLNYVGYKKKSIAFSDFVKKPIVLLEPSPNVLTEVTVYATNNYLYALFERCRQNLITSPELKSKVYFTLETEIAAQPVELLECFYNGTYNNTSVKQLQFKNGRCGLAPYGKMIYQNINSSKVFTFLSLTVKNPLLPRCPLQLNKKTLKKDFHLKLLSVSFSADSIYTVEFLPVKENGKSFSGVAWIEKHTGQLRKIRLSVQNTSTHPFLPLFQNSGKISSASMQVTKTFDEENRPDHIDFHYQLNYSHLSDPGLADKNPDTTFEVKSRGLLYFYDHNSLFYPPYFDYDEEISDYRKINSLTYNDGFWSIHKGPVYSDKMKSALRYFKKNGELINYGNSNPASNKVVAGNNYIQQGRKNIQTNSQFSSFYENNYIQWSPQKRILLRESKIKNDSLYSQVKPGKTVIELYELSAQIFMDLNPFGDSVQHCTATVFDVWNTFYNIPEQPFTNAFLNIYFDLHEIARRDLEKKITGNKFSVTQFDSLYKEMNVRLQKQRGDYLRSVERGTKMKELEKWNLYVKERLEIDNFEIFQLYPRIKTEQ